MIYRPSTGTVVRRLRIVLFTLSVAAAVGAQPQINEFVANHVGADSNELVEILGAPRTDYSSLSVLEIEGDDGAGSGDIESRIDVGTTDDQGLWWTGYLSSNLQNGTSTLLLVEEFSGAVGEDVDTDDDGVIDYRPWTAIVDSVAVLEEDGSGLTYSPVVLTAGFDGGDTTVGGGSRFATAGDPSDWLRNDFDGAGLDCCAPGSPEPGEAINTGGLPNEAVDGGSLGLSVTGVCPGTIEVAVSGGTAGGIAGLLASPATGSDPLTAGPCAGVVTGLSSPVLLTTVVLDAAGGATLTPTVGDVACGVHLQVVDGASCEVSNVAAIP